MWRRASIVVAAVALLTGCDRGGDRADAPDSASDSLTVTSSAFSEGQAIPTKYTCDGEETSPPLAWSGVPDDAPALALVIDDPDAPGGTYVHWVLVDIEAGERSIAAGDVPAGAVEVKNTSGDAAYAGPCPPGGDTHRYRFTVYALSHRLEVRSDDDLDAVFDEIAGAAVAQGRLTATYARE